MQLKEIYEKEGYCGVAQANNKRKEARGEESIGRDYLSLDGLCKSIYRHTSANLALSCRKTISLHIYRAPPSNEI